MTASIGLSRTLIENLHLRWSAIGKESCVVPGERDPKVVDADLNYGIDYRYGYTRDSCQLISKQEMVARELLFCTFNPLTGDNIERCRPNQAVTYYTSLLEQNTTTSSNPAIVYIDNKAGLRKRYDKKCLADCLDDRFVFGDFLLHLNKYLCPNSSSKNIIILRQKLIFFIFYKSTFKSHSTNTATFIVLGV